MDGVDEHRLLSVYRALCNGTGNKILAGTRKKIQSSDVWKQVWKWSFIKTREAYCKKGELVIKQQNIAFNLAGHARMMISTIRIKLWEKLMFSETKTCFQSVLYFVAWSQSKVISFWPIILLCQPATVQQENRVDRKKWCNCENSLQREMVNENKSSLGRMRVKTPSVRCGHYSGQHHLLCCKCRHSVQIHSFCCWLFQCWTWFKSCCAYSKGSMGWMSILLFESPMLINISVDVQKKISIFTDPQGFYPFMYWI